MAIAILSGRMVQRFLFLHYFDNLIGRKDRKKINEELYWDDACVRMYSLKYAVFLSFWQKNKTFESLSMFVQLIFSKKNNFKWFLDNREIPGIQYEFIKKGLRLTHLNII